MASELIGVADLVKKLRELGKMDDGKVTRSAVRAGAKTVVKRAKELIPEGIDAHRTYKGRLVAPGFARRAIRAITKLSRDKQAATASIGVRKEAYYAVQFVERGTVKQAAQPWLRPALDQASSAALTAIKDTFKRFVDKVARSK